MRLHGYVETSHTRLPLIKELADTHTVVAPELRAASSSAAQETGYTKAAMLQDIHALTSMLGWFSRSAWPAKT
jgi:haloacetate dehalogenase